MSWSTYCNILTVPPTKSRVVTVTDRPQILQMENDYTRN